MWRIVKIQLVLRRRITFRIPIVLLLFGIFFVIPSTVIAINQDNLVNYDFNNGSSYLTLTPELSADITASVGAEGEWQTYSGTATGPLAFVLNSTPGNAIARFNSSGNNTKYWTFKLEGSALNSYVGYEMYLQARRSSTGAQTITIAYSIDGDSYTNFDTMNLPFENIFYEKVFDLSSVTALDNQDNIYIRVMASGATGTGTLRIDNFQIQATAVTLDNLVNFDFNNGNSYATLTPTLAPNITASVTAEGEWQTYTGTATGLQAFIINNTLGNAIAMSNSSGTNTRFWTFQLGGMALDSYADYEMYLQARRSPTGAQIITIAYSIDGLTYTNFGTTMSLPTADDFYQNVFNLSSVTALNNQENIYIRVMASGASGTGTLRIDNFQIRATDNTAPVFTVNESTSLAIVQSDIINITVYDPNLDASSLEYGFSANSICDNTDIYGNLFTSDTDFNIAGNHTDYLCVKASDTGNIVGYSLVGQLHTDNMPPTVPGIPMAVIGSNLTSQIWSWTASTDAVAGMSLYRWRVDGGPSGTTTSPTVTTNLTAGNWRFYVKAEDNIGNQSAERSSLLAVLSASINQVVVDCSDPLVYVITTEDVANPTLDLSPIVIPDGQSLVANLNCEIHLKTLLSSAVVIVDIPSGSIVKGSASTWSKVLVPPIATTPVPNLLPSAPQEFKNQISLAIKVGHHFAELEITKGVRIFLEGQAGKRAGHISNNIFSEITNTCAEDSQSTGDALSTGEDCKIENGSDLIIWTKHFSEFVTYDFVPSPTITYIDWSSPPITAKIVQIAPASYSVPTSYVVKTTIPVIKDGANIVKATEEEGLRVDILCIFCVGSIIFIGSVLLMFKYPKKLYTS